MLGWVLNSQAPIEKSPLKLVKLADPEPAEDELRIKVLACGLCHTDLHEVEGELSLPKLPLILGHQVVGVVDKIGEKVKNVKEGERVGVAWLYSSCGECFYCKTGFENLCENVKFTGFDVDGGYAEYMISKPDFTYKLPEECDYKSIAPLLCAGIIGYRAFRLSDVSPKETLGLFGFGASAHIVCQIARYFDIDVLAFSRSAHHRELAKKLGASWAGGIEDNPPQKLDRGIIFAPSGRMVPEALKFIRPGGTLAIASVYMDMIPEMDYNKFIYGERTIRSVTASTRKDAIELIELAGKIPIRTEVEVFEFDRLNQALNKLKQAKIQGAGVLAVSKE